MHSRISSFIIISTKIEKFKNWKRWGKIATLALPTNSFSVVSHCFDAHHSCLILHTIFYFHWFLLCFFTASIDLVRFYSFLFSSFREFLPFYLHSYINKSREQNKPKLAKKTRRISRWKFNFNLVADCELVIGNGITYKLDLSFEYIVHSKLMRVKFAEMPSVCFRVFDNWSVQEFEGTHIRVEFSFSCE